MKFDGNTRLKKNLRYVPWVGRVCKGGSPGSYTSKHTAVAVNKAEATDKDNNILLWTAERASGSGARYEMFDDRLIGIGGSRVRGRPGRRFADDEADRGAGARVEAVL